jgi:hypothetical protein
VTQNVLFPQLRVGSQTRVKWRFEQRGKPLLGFNYSWRPSFMLPVEQARIKITYKDDVPLRFDARGGFAVQESAARGERVVEAELRDYAGQLPEKAMVSPRDLCPEFVATTLDRWETIGARFHAAVADKIESTPEIDALAATIVGERVGLEAARAIHRWVCGNVQYVAVYLREMSGWVPHSASEVLKNGYGDCKDQFVLMASLLRSRGIEAEPVLVNYDRSFVPFPIATPLQFNHCMAYLPEFDLYSNPIDPYRDLGELEVMLSDKFVVIASPEGRIGRTPAGSADKNRYHIEQTVAIAADGSVSGRASLDFAGRPAGRFRRTLALAANVEQPADDLLAGSPFGGRGELVSSDACNLEIPLHCEGSWSSDIPLSFDPRLQFEVPVGLDLLNPALLLSFISDSTRQYPTLIAAIQISSRHQVELPSGFKFVSFPKGRSIKNEAGSFESRYSMNDAGQVAVERELRIEQDRYAPEQYAALREVLLAATIDLEAGLTAEAAQ